jgi:TonB-linked SusC/RagA family outer membrane protein
MQHFSRLLEALFSRGVFSFALAMTISLLLLPGARAQDVGGQVVEQETGEPLPGVNITVVNTTTGTTTDQQGRYQLAVPSLSDTLRFSFVGYQTRTVPIDGRTQIDLTLRPSEIMTEEVLVVGYGTQQASEVSGAISTTPPAELDNVTKTSAEALLQGRMPGVRVETGGGSPNSETTVVIRGTGTFGNDQPLYIVDGLKTNSMGFLNPRDIESIQVLKDASTAAIYGNRAANGVVLVETKKGAREQDGIRVNFSSSVGVQRPTNTYDFLNARQYARHNNEFHRNDGLPIAPAYTEENFNFEDPAVDTDWQDVQINDPTDATVARTNLGVSGGGEASSFYVSGEYMNRIGLVNGTDYKRYGVRINSQFEFGKFRIQESMAATRVINDPNSYFGRERGALPVIPVRDESNLGGFAGVEPSFHGVARGINWYGVEVLNQNTVTTDQVIGNIEATYSLLSNLQVDLNLALEYGQVSNYDFMPAFFQSTSQEAFNDVADLNESNNRQFDTMIETTVSYDESIGNHNIDLLGGLTHERDQTNTANIQVAGFPNNQLRQIAAASETIATNGQLFESVLRSGFGRLNYNYDNTYLVSATIRADGSSKFREGNRWGTFPAVSAGWRISEESFSPEFFDELKIRGSYGTLGNQNIGPYEAITGLNVNASAFFPGGVEEGTALTNFSNPEIQWEETTMINVGLDAAFLSNAMTVTLDYFEKESEGILANVPIPLAGGVGESVLQNAASVRNHGLELGARYNQEFDGGLQLTVSGNLSRIRNEVEKLGEGVNPIAGGSFTQQGFNATRTAPGRPIASFYGFIVDGIYQSAEAAQNSGRDNVQAGDFRFRDLNDDGLINDEDRTFIGSPHPDYQFGINANAQYGSWNVAAFIQGVQGNDIWNAKKFQYILDNAGGNKIAAVMDAWTPSNTDTDIPRATLQDPAGNKRASTFFVEDGSYLRLKSLQVTYDLPAALAQTVGRAFGAEPSISFYVRAENLLTLTGYSGYDPEIGRNSGFRNTGLFGQGVDVNAHPRPETYSVGLNMTF